MARVDYYGADEIIRKLDDLGANVEEELSKALIASCQKPKQEMLSWIREDHRVKTKDKPYKRTGDTEASFIEKIKTDKEEGKIYLEIGFNLQKEDGKPGLPALYLNWGTPFIEPSYFIEKAINNNRDEIKRVQEETLIKALRKAQLK